MQGGGGNSLMLPLLPRLNTEKSQSVTQDLIQINNKSIRKLYKFPFQSTEAILYFQKVKGSETHI